jgi:plasmid stability protein
LADILVRNVDDRIVHAMKRRARESGRSMNDVARDLLETVERPSPRDLVEMSRRIRAMSGPFTDDSTVLIREDRDNDDPYR